MTATDTPIAEIFPEATSPADLDEWIYGDGAGGEGIDYFRGDAEGEVQYRLIRDHWILSAGEYINGTWTARHWAYLTRARAVAGYAEVLTGLQGEGVEFEVELPEYCPDFMKIQATW